MKSALRIACLAIAAAALATILVAVPQALAARNSSGTMALVAGNPTAPGQLITSTLWNSIFADFQNEMTDSLSRTGKGGMLFALRGLDGTAGTPSISFTSENNLGFYRSGTGDLGVAVGGLNVAHFISTGLQGNVAGVITSPSVSTFTGSASRAPINLVPLATPSTPSNGDIWIDTGDNTAKAQVNGVTKTLLFSPLTAKSQLPSIGAVTSASSGTYGSTGVIAQSDVPGLSVSLTTGGRAVFVVMQPDGSANAATIGLIGSQTGNLYLVKDGSTIGKWSFTLGSGGSGVAFPVFVDTAASAAAHTYKIQYSEASGVPSINNFVLVAYEL